MNEINFENVNVAQVPKEQMQAEFLMISLGPKDMKIARKNAALFRENWTITHIIPIDKKWNFKEGRETPVDDSDGAQYVDGQQADVEEGMQSIRWHAIKFI